MSYGNEYQETLRPGVLVASKVAPEGGTLGCFARLAGDPSKVVILSNSHVLYGDVASLGGSGDGAEVGQPSVSCCLCCTCRVVATNRLARFTQVTVNVTSPISTTETGSEVDCAIALLNGKRAYTNEALYGMVTGTPASGMGVSGNDPVELVGSTSGRSTGKVLEFNHTATYQSGGSGTVPKMLFPISLQGTAIDESFAGVLPSINQMLIVPDPDPNDPNRAMHLVGRGDSGSVVVNAARQVVGVISRAWSPSASGRAFLNQFLATPLPAHAGTLGIAASIAPVLSVLGIQIDNNMSGTATAAGVSLAELQHAETERQAEVMLQVTLRDLEAEVRAKALGAEVMAALDRHRAEVLRLVDAERRVTVTWRRNAGPAWAAHCLHSIRDHRYILPREVDGVTARELLVRMARVLARFGSAELRAAIENYEEMALDWAADCTGVWQLVERMRGLEEAERAATTARENRGVRRGRG